jgi:hypothetical protein
MEQSFARSSMLFVALGQTFGQPLRSRKEQRRLGRFSLRRVNIDRRLERVSTSPTLPAVAGATRIIQ